MSSYSLPGKYFCRESRKGGFDVLYKSFKHRVVVYRCWLNNRHSAEEMVDDLNAKLFSEYVDGNVVIENRIEKVEKIIHRSRSL